MKNQAATTSETEELRTENRTLKETVEKERNRLSELRREIEDKSENESGTSSEVTSLKSENEAFKEKEKQWVEKGKLTSRTLEDSKLQCLAASTTIDKVSPKVFVFDSATFLTKQAYRPFVSRPLRMPITFV